MLAVNRNPNSATRLMMYFLAKAGFGGTEYLLPKQITEAKARGISFRRVAELTSRNPALRYGLSAKGNITVGRDTHLTLVDPGLPWTMRTEGSESSQEYTLFEGYQMNCAVTHTFLRKQDIF